MTTINGNATPNRWATSALVLIIVSSIAIALHAFAFQARLSGSPDLHARFDTIPVMSTMHVLGGAVVLLLGGWQFSTRLRRSRPNVHRWMGRVYLTCVLLGGVAGLFLAPLADGGIVAKFGFATLAVLWLYSGFKAYTAVRRGDILNHRLWMLRNFALTLGAVTLRIYLGLFIAIGVPFPDAYPAVAWLSWVLNLVFVEWYLAPRKHSAPLSATAAQKWSGG